MASTSVPPEREYEVHFEADVPATLDNVSRICARLTELAARCVGGEWAAELDLGLTEALSNVVRHGYRFEHGRLEVCCQGDGNAWRFEARDQGRPIPADKLAQADGSVFDFNPADLESIPEGGMGLALIRRCFDSLVYESADRGNRLVLTKNTTPKAT